MPTRVKNSKSKLATNKKKEMGIGETQIAGIKVRPDATVGQLMEACLALVSANEAALEKSDSLAFSMGYSAKAAKLLNKAVKIARTVVDRQTSEVSVTTSKNSALHYALTHLNYAQRTILQMQHFEGRSIKECTKFLGWTKARTQRYADKAIDSMRYMFKHAQAIEISGLESLMKAINTEEEPEVK